MALDTTEAKLQDPFEPNDIKWRVQQSGISNGTPWMIVLPYITGRAIQKRLDDVFGVFGWEVEQKETLTGDGFLTTLRVWHEGRWVSKTDVAPKTGIEPLKGGASGGLKRVGALFGIGRYLYQLEPGFASCVFCDNRRNAMYNYAEIKGKDGTKRGVDWQPPALPDWALPGLDAEKFKEAISSATCLLDVKAAYDDAYRWAASFSRTDLIKKFKDIREATIENLQSEAMKDVSAKEQEVSAWLDKKIKDINSIVYAGTVQNLGNNAAIELMKKCEGQHFDKQALEKKLKQAVKDRVKTLEGK